MAHWILFCKNCKQRKPSGVPDEWFLYCSKECKNMKTEALIKKRLEQLEDEYLKASAEKSLGELRALGYANKDGTKNERVTIPRFTEDGVPILPPEQKERKPSNRKCGKCGDAGHNARTCGKRKSYNLLLKKNVEE